MAYGKRWHTFKRHASLQGRRSSIFLLSDGRLFDNVLHKPFYISLADAEAVEYLNLDPEKFEVTELDDLKDYLYDGNAMRTLAGKKLHKKKNRLNGFLKTYEGRYEYRRICCSDRQEVWQFMENGDSRK